MRFESLFVGRRPLKWNFGLPTHVLFCIKNALTRINWIWISLFSYKVSFVTTLSLEFIIIRFVLISWLFLVIDCIGLVTIFIWSIRIKGYVFFSLHIFPNNTGATLCRLIIKCIGGSSWWFFIPTFVASLKYLWIIMALLHFWHLILNWLLNWQRLIKRLISRLRLKS